MDRIANVGDDHPLALEIQSLRKAVASSQHEAHEAAIKLQKHSLDSSESYERTRELESENARLKEEVAVLRAYPDDSSSATPFQFQELELAHQRLSDQLGITEATLELRTTELTDAQAALAKARADAAGAFALSAAIRAREEDGLQRERALRSKLRVTDEERKMADLVVREYADLVRTLEGRASVLPPRPPSKDGAPDPDPDAAGGDGDGRGYAEGRRGLQTLLREFSVESERLEGRIAALEHELMLAGVNRESEGKASERDRALLAKVQAELVKIRVDDKTAARMVSRYMEFSQTSTNALQSTIAALKPRHAATLKTLSLESEHLQIALRASERQTAKLRDALDHLSADLARETYGRRREVGLRLALLLREARVAEGLQRWAGKAREMLYRAQQRAEGRALEEAFERSVQGAEGLLAIFNGDGGVGSGEREDAVVGRIVAAQCAVAEMGEELRVETGRRMELERQRALERLTAPHAANGEALVHSNGGANGTAAAASNDTETPPTRVHDISEPINGHASSAIRAVANPTAQTPPPTQESKPHTEDTPARHFVPAANFVHQPRPRSIEEATFVRDPPSSPPESPLAASTTEDVFTATIASSPPPALHPQRHPLLADLEATKHRYDELQRAFRECHQTLKALQDSIGGIASSSVGILRVATQRLDDFNEDARVEVEIRIADEELTIKGYETLLAIPGAIDSAAQDAVEGRIQAFVGGTEKSVAKALEQFNRKLDDLQHDAASIKRALHELPEDEEAIQPRAADVRDGDDHPAPAALVVGLVVHAAGAQVVGGRERRRRACARGRGSVCGPRAADTHAVAYGRVAGLWHAAEECERCGGAGAVEHVLAGAGLEGLFVEYGYTRDAHQGEGYLHACETAGR
ncbi:hypothetical protein FIBSPDRAFT_933562 [Athelia psychrophila]|uniref:Uncharacterized protein n=1 Tax=Athelia psychrophila TaxID=1759441 RepID=A0A166GYN0_9AGAM|nr:hypothetical protein FIBSPDRAFT_933562 [Fibularhizoctonia sp. CBS 109695]